MLDINSNSMFVGEPPMPFEMLEDDSDDDYGFFLDADNAYNYDDDDDDSTDNDNSSEFVTYCPSHELIYASRIIDIANPHSLHSHPPILSPSMVDTIVEHGLPWSMQDSRWNRLFAASRDDVDDGSSSFVTFMRRVRDQDQTIIVAKTSTGRIVGGYATNVWSGRRRTKQQQNSNHHDFLFVVESSTTTTSTKSKLLHTGMTFMHEDHQQLLLGKSPTSTASHFDISSSSNSSPTSSTKHHRRCNNNNSTNKPWIEIFKQDHNHHKYDNIVATTTSTGSSSSSSSSWKQVCHMGRTLLSMSSDTTSCCGTLSLVIHHSFSRGEISLGSGGSGGASTREESVSGGDCSMEEFDIVEFEVYGFTDED
ncbi:hypothetical protein ACHAWU_000302 [Discostella pseudostelligera]|uniref:TLDc domain-containing protein n=1 Tax=Discostella pseudostelligera TaxID=259834 RepID=A0ABD3MC91_9STRA